MSHCRLGLGPRQGVRLERPWMMPRVDGWAQSPVTRHRPGRQLEPRVLQEASLGSQGRQG
jgi:hypothetical protein